MALPTQDDAIHFATKRYLSGLDMDKLPSLDELKAGVLQATHEEFDLHNAGVSKSARWKMPASLDEYQVAMLIQTVEHVRCIYCGGKSSNPERDLLGIYQECGPDAGLYVTDYETISRMIREYNRNFKSSQIKEVVAILRESVPHVSRCQERDLIAVNNGIFDYKTKMLQGFSPDKVYLAKCRINYTLAPMLPVIHNDDGTDWDVESWLNELSDDPEIVQLIWEILGAIIRPFVSWGRSAWFYSTTGNNGKGSLCALMRNLCGPGSYASIPISDFGKEFALEPLTRATAIIVDENDVGTFVDKAANLKAIITHDVFTINIKYKNPFDYQFFGFMVQCLNEFPRIRDKSDSFYRRQLFVPFTKCFTGRERRYIKDDYLIRPEVLEYVLHKVLHMDYYELSEPQACKAVLNTYKQYNDPVRQFAEEILPQCCWDLLPFSFLYDLYKAWFRRNSPSGVIQGKITFLSDLRAILPNFPAWECNVDSDGKPAHVRRANRMDEPELLIAEYDLAAWKNPQYTGGDRNQICRPALQNKYTGLLRVSPATQSPDDS